MVFATPIAGSDGYMVDLDCGHRIATREQRVDYHCRTCDGPTPAHDPIESARRAVEGAWQAKLSDVAALLSAHDAHRERADVAEARCARLRGADEVRCREIMHEVRMRASAESDRDAARAEVARLQQDIADLNAHVARVEDKLAHATEPEQA